MLYWVIWLTAGTAFAVIFSAFVLPKIFIKSREAFLQNPGMRNRKFIWLTVLSLSLALDVGLVCWLTAAFTDRAVKGYPIGINEDICAFIVWPIYVFALVAVTLFIIGAVIINLRGRGQQEYFPSLSPSCQDSAKPQCGKDKEIYRSFLKISAVVLLAMSVLAATAILTLIFNYILAAKFSLSASKKIILILLVLEYAAIFIIFMCMRKKLKHFRMCIYSICITLFAMIIAGYLLLVFAQRSTVEKFLIWSGSGVLVATGLSVLLTFLLVVGARNRINRINFGQEILQGKIQTENKLKGNQK